MHVWIGNGLQDAWRILRETPVSTTVVFILLPVSLVGSIVYAAICSFH